MTKWMKRRLDQFHAQLQRQEQLLDSARHRSAVEEVARLEQQIATTKSEMLRVIQS